MGCIWMIFISFVFLDACTQSIWGSKIPSPIYGVTIDNTRSLNAIVKSLAMLPRKASARIVFDPGVSANHYLPAVREIKKVSYVMGEILDSESMGVLSVADYLKRTREYLSCLKGQVDLWEIGNEVNGEWLGKSSEVILKISGAYDFVKNQGESSALTLFYNENCWEKPENRMFDWARRNLPDRVKKGVDCVFISHYEDQCKGPRPDWTRVFKRLGEIFPNSKLGFGEVGTSSQKNKENLVNHYYRLKIRHPRFVGGYFWWYFTRDMVPHERKLWKTLHQAMLGELPRLD